MSQFENFLKIITPASTQLTHNFFKTLLESCAELVWDKRCSNIVATFDKYISCGNVDDTSSQSRELIVYKANYTKICKICFFIQYWKWVISNVVTTLQQRYLATYNVAATLFGNIFPTFAQRCHSTLWHLSHSFPGLRFHNFHSLLWKRCYNL